MCQSYLQDHFQKFNKDFYNEQLRVFFLLFLAKDTVGLAALRNPQFFNIYVPVTVNIWFVFKQTLEVSSMFMDTNRLTVIPWPWAPECEEQILV